MFWDGEREEGSQNEISSICVHLGNSLVEMIETKQMNTIWKHGQELKPIPVKCVLLTHQSQMFPQRVNNNV